MIDSVVFILGGLGALIIVIAATWVFCANYQRAAHLARRAGELKTEKSVAELGKSIAEGQRQKANAVGVTLRDERDALAKRAATLERLLAAEGMDIEAVPAREAGLALVKRRAIRQL